MLHLADVTKGTRIVVTFTGSKAPVEFDCIANCVRWFQGKPDLDSVEFVTYTTISARVKDVPLGSYRVPGVAGAKAENNGLILVITLTDPRLLEDAFNAALGVSRASHVTGATEPGRPAELRCAGAVGSIPGHPSDKPPGPLAETAGDQVAVFVSRPCPWYY